MTTDLRYIDAESKTAAQVLTSTTHCACACVLGSLLAHVLAHVAHSLAACLLTRSLAYSRTTVQVTSSAVMKFKCTGKGKKAGSSPNSSFKGGGAAEAT